MWLQDSKSFSSVVHTFLYECTELWQEREDAERKTGVLLPRKRKSEAFVQETDLKESLLTH